MKTKPILFSAPMVRALLDGSKTQTRRAYKAKNGGVWPNANDLPGMRQILRNCPYGQPGEQLWVREAWRTVAGADDIAPRNLMNVEPYTHYEADDNGTGMGRLRPSIHMPRWASRITLEITGVRVERLQNISAADAFDEGIKITVDAATKEPLMRLTGKFPPATYIKGNGLVIAEYASLWECINGADSWASNPWVWVVIFKRTGENK